MAVMKTPGVYIVEKNAFPNSVVEVATAVPAFVGYTEHASDSGKTLTNTAYRISSMAEFERYFGGPPPASFEVKAAPADTAGDFSVKSGKTTVAYEVNLTTKQFRLYYAMKHFFQNYGGACWIVSVGDYGKTGDGAPSGMGGIDADAIMDGIKSLELEQEPTMLVIPDIVEFASVDDCIKVQQDMLKHCGDKMKNRFAILDVWGASAGKVSDNVVKDFRGKLGVNNLMYGAAYYPWVHTRLITENDFSYGQFGGAGFAAILTDVQKPFEKTPDDVALDDAGWKAKATAEEVKAEDVDAWIASRKDQTNKALYQASPNYQAALQVAARKLNLTPPSAAMAGLYTMVDNSRGVWKAPANVSLQNVLAPAVSISHEDQENLNVDAQGKSINAIRSFIGEGVLVWGARTLDGNSLDWRYINVRRTMIMLEESCKLAAKAMVFEPNTAGTWLTIKSMIQNFLNGVWRRGGLMGAIPDDAFSVHCGLGETMTPEDVLEGILRVTVLVCMVRPAEFIEITFQQLMPKS